MNKKSYYYIQFFAAISLMGFWVTNALCTLYWGDTTSAISIAYRAALTCMAIFAIYLCRQDIHIERQNTFQRAYVFIMCAYTLRMLYDTALGPYVGIVPHQNLINNIFFTCISVFFTAYALLICRNHLNINNICSIVYILGLIIIIIVPYIVDIETLLSSDSEERMDAGRGLSTLALMKIGAIEVIASLHLLLNKKMRLLYIPGLILGLWLCLSSGSRGGLVALIIALGVYWLITSRKNILINMIVICGIVAVCINIIPILEWISQYFPVFGNRMLETIVDNDQSGREVLRERAYELIMDNPTIGYSYMLSPTETGYGCHNGILDIFIAFGIPLGLLCLYYIYVKPLSMSIKMFNTKQHFFAFIMPIWVIIASLSGAGFTDSTFAFAMCIMSSTFYKGSNNYISNK